VRDAMDYKRELRASVKADDSAVKALQ